MTIANALQAKEYGASIQTRVTVTHATVQNNLWQLTAKKNSGQEQRITAKVLVNATGPWVESFNKLLGIPSKFEISLVKGSHLVVHKLYEGNHAYLLQHDDKRIIFVVPYHGYTMIGTTDVAFKGALDEVCISTEEVNYLCNLVNNYFQCRVQRKDIINSWSGVRPLLASLGEDLKALSRDYTYDCTHLPAPALTVYGGKITTYRQLALESVDSLQAFFPSLRKSRTDSIPLPGSTFENWTYKDYAAYAHEKYYWLNESIVERYLTSYGTRTELLLSGCEKMGDLGLHFGNDLYQIEVDYLQNEEWACVSDDILWRRTKLGLNFELEQKQALEDYCQQRLVLNN
ncbi:glycerol-3-phosphate dehydrogenase [Legionella tunisiensis]|uniref:glycerol-3-phosphate dehydrogenase n=1 Tax=Legionella tunisiensis TaxID=1034944 RepID=UPI00031ED5F5|nr:glycerol-3-phosphate dehydrogenase [Legionella tunisiensis]